MTYRKVSETCPKCKGKGTIEVEVFDEPNTLAASFDAAGLLEDVEGSDFNDLNLIPEDEY